MANALRLTFFGAVFFLASLCSAEGGSCPQVHERISVSRASQVVPRIVDRLLEDPLLENSNQLSGLFSDALISLWDQFESPSAIQSELAFLSLLKSIQDSVFDGSFQREDLPNEIEIWVRSLWLQANREIFGELFGGELLQAQTEKLRLRSDQIEFLSRQLEVQARAQKILDKIGRTGFVLRELLTLEDLPEQQLNLEALQWLESNMEASEFEKLFCEIDLILTMATWNIPLDSKAFKKMISLAWAKWFFEVSQSYPLSAATTLNVERQALLNLSGSNLKLYLQETRRAGLKAFPRVSVKATNSLLWYIELNAVELKNSKGSKLNKIRTYVKLFPVSQISQDEYDEIIRKVVSIYLTYLQESKVDRDPVLLDQYPLFEILYDPSRASFLGFDKKGQSLFNNLVSEAGAFLQHLHSKKDLLSKMGKNWFDLKKERFAPMIDRLTKAGVSFQAFDKKGFPFVAAWSEHHFPLLTRAKIDFTVSHPTTPSFFFQGPSMFFGVAKPVLKAIDFISSNLLSQSQKQEVLNRVNQQGRSFVFAGLEQLVARLQDPSHMFKDTTDFIDETTLHYLKRLQGYGLDLWSERHNGQSICDLLFLARELQVKRMGKRPFSPQDLEKLRELGCQR